MGVYTTLLQAAPAVASPLSGRGTPGKDGRAELGNWNEGLGDTVLEFGLVSVQRLGERCEDELRRFDADRQADRAGLDS